MPQLPESISTLPARLTRPGRGIKGKDVNLPDPNKPDVMKSLGQAAKGFKQLRELTSKSRSPSKR